MTGFFYYTGLIFWICVGLAIVFTLFVTASMLIQECKEEREREIFNGKGK